MKTPFKNLDPRLPVAIILFSCACSARSTSTPQQASQTLEDMTLSETNSGIVQWTIHSPHGEMQERAGRMELATPQIDLFKEGKPSGDVRAQKGSFQEQSGDIHLSGDVVVNSREDHSTLETEALDYIGAKSRFQTDLPVLITRPSGRMRGRGMVANHDLSEIHILHQEATLQ